MKKIFAVILGISLSFSALADDFDKTKKLAESGDVDAQLKVAQDFYDKKNYANAFRWFSKASKKGSAEANYKLAWLYYDGKGVKEDNAKFLDFLTKSANQGYVKAQFNLGLNYESGNYVNGKIVNQDYTKAKLWYEKASAQGDSNSTFFISRLYYNGRGVPKNIKTAIKYTQKAAKQGNVIAQFELAQSYEDGYDLPQDYQKAFYWYQQSANLGFFKSQYRLAKLYEDGKGIPINLSSAKQWYGKSCEQNEGDSCEKYQQLKQKGY